mmetsp:Transcript_20147/g.49506  ORF Transcript_20147/g.49506 Transcript_20147/m.49506 type:complete len:216 (+) Transcript_20147:424-1071(+)
MVPHCLKHPVKIPLILGRDRHIVRNPVKQIQLLDRDLVNHVAHVHARDVHAHHPDLVCALDDIQQLVHRHVITQRDLRVVDPVLPQDALQDLRRDVRGRVGQLHVQLDPPLVVLLEVHVRLALVQANTETVQLLLDQLLVRHRLRCVQHNANERAGACRADNALSAPLAVLRALNNPRKIQQLDLGPLVPDDARNASECCELVGGRLRVCPRELC